MSTQNKNTLVRWMCDIARAENDSLAPYRDHIMMSMGAATFVVLLPFVLNNIWQGRLSVVAILILVLLVIAVDTHALWRGRRAPIPYALLLVPFVLGVTVAVVVQGVPGVLWVYPIVLYCYFVLSRRVAVVCSLALLVYVAGLAQHFIDGTLAFRVFGTVLVTIVMINIVLNVISDLHRTLANQALTDPLTGAYNRRFMEEVVDGIVAHAARTPRLATLLMIDVDHFKAINDRFGHDQGDRVLCEIVRLIDARMRRQDRVFRLGGEEFILLLEDTDVYGAEVVAESIRAAVEQAALLPVQSVTISIGISQHNDGMSTEMWIRAADQALYRAKAAGRNRVQRAE